MWFNLATREDFVVEISVVECGTRRKAEQFEQSLILSLLGYKHQAVKQRPEVILINYTISVLVHETESSQSILQTKKKLKCLKRWDIFCHNSNSVVFKY